MTSKNGLGIGIIGCGNISSTYLRLARLFSTIKIRAVADINRAAALARSEEFRVQALSIEDLLNADDIDIIVNLTVPDAHFEVSQQILEAGKHVYSEKPLALSLEDGKSLQNLAQESGLRIGSAPDTFLGGAHQQARIRIDEGKIGTVISGTAYFMNHGMEHWHPNPGFFYLPGGGPILDIGPYYITNLIQLIGPIRRVASLTTTACGTRTVLADGPIKGKTIPVKTATNIHALLEFRSGAAVTLGASWDVWAHRHSHMEIYGTMGSVYLPDPNFFGGPVEFTEMNGTAATPENWEHPFSIPNEGHSVMGTLSNYRTVGLAEMAQAIRDNRAHRCSLEMALHAVDAMTSILKAGEENRWCELSTSCARPEPFGRAEAQSLLA
ncbi:MAG: Gfo/Idh/MocA family oxidoreductase [Albidovulum sp.]|nr:Gfo/Idh/MocA family oxidoreductase [Albidovulum sp.]MDE0532232.1 Gfo/Idh/MocA family oxidoreductase [Albidovulum sp.]